MLLAEMFSPGCTDSAAKKTVQYVCGHTSQVTYSKTNYHTFRMEQTHSGSHATQLNLMLNLLIELADHTNLV